MKQLITAVIIQLFLILQSCGTEPNGGDGGNGIDTTSQNFTFETYEFGDGGNSSYFNDVWVFNENNIWAVGEVSLPGGFTNIMRWNGEKWYAQKPWFTSSGFSGIWAADSSNIYFATGAVRKYENGNFLGFDLGHLGFTNGQAVHKLWGSSENNIWGVGPWGTVVHFDGSEWKKIEFDTQWYFYGITGNKDTGTAYAVARNSDFITIITELKNLNAEIIYQQKDPSAFSISLFDKENLILSNNKVWTYNLQNSTTEVISNFGNGYFLPIKAFNKKNDIYFFGNLINTGERLLHYNGTRVKDIPFSNRLGVIYGGASAIDNLAVMGGFANNKAYLIMVRREK